MLCKFGFHHRTLRMRGTNFRKPHVCSYILLEYERSELKQCLEDKRWWKMHETLQRKTILNWTVGWIWIQRLAEKCWADWIEEKLEHGRRSAHIYSFDEEISITLNTIQADRRHSLLRSLFDREWKTWGTKKFHIVEKRDENIYREVSLFRDRTE